MEENEQKPVEEQSVQTEDKGAESAAEAGQPTREEILAASRKENKNGDERDKSNYLRGMQLAYGVGVIIISVITLVCTLIGNKMPLELWIVYMAMTTTWSLYYAVRTEKRRPLFISCGVICAIACAFNTVYWILQLCGVL